MNNIVVYFSRTGNTKKFAEALAQAANAELFDVASVAPANVAECDMLIFGTPVEGASPSKEATTFLNRLESVSGKKAIVFNTCRLFGNSRTNKALEKMLKAKGYDVILELTKKVKPNKETDFSEAVAEVNEMLSKLA